MFGYPPAQSQSDDSLLPVGLGERFERCLLHHLGGREIYPNPYDDEAWRNLDIEDANRKV